MNTLAAWLVLLMYIAFAIKPFQNLLRGFIARIGDWTVGLFLLPYLLARNFQPDWGELTIFMVFITIPTLLLDFRPKNAKAFDLFQVLAILALWFPIEPSLFMLVLDLITLGKILPPQLMNIQLLPDVNAALIPGVSLPVPILIAGCLSLYLFLIRYPVKGIGFSFRFRWNDLKVASIGLAMYTLVGLPLGFGMGFLRFNPNIPSMSELVGSILAGYLLVALIEEILFRGVIQNLLEKRLQKPTLALILASAGFGLAHLNNATLGFPVPNWAYVLMATAAGFVYGWVWRQTGKVTISAITHMLVNLTWGLLLT